MISDDFGKVAFAMMASDDIWAATVRNAQTLALYGYMMRLLQRKFVEDIVDPMLVPGAKEPYYMRKIKSNFKTMIKPLYEMVPGEVCNLMGQTANCDDYYIGKYHSDRVPWVAMLSTDITGEAVIQSKLPRPEDFRQQFSQKEVLARDENSVRLHVEPGSALILRGVAGDYMTPFHPVPRCPPGKARLCVAVHP